MVVRTGYKGRTNGGRAEARRYSAELEGRENRDRISPDGYDDAEITNLVNGLNAKALNPPRSP